MKEITIHILKPAKGITVTFQGMLLRAEPGHVEILAHWERAALDLGYVVFEPGDRFYEHFYTDRWFNIYEVRCEQGRLKGWYCNITRPAQIEGDVVTSEDLELDLFVSPDRANLLRLDADEFAARGLDVMDPAAYEAALGALNELEQLARDGVPPFDAV